MVFSNLSPANIGTTNQGVTIMPTKQILKIIKVKEANDADQYPNFKDKELLSEVLFILQR